MRKISVNHLARNAIRAFGIEAVHVGANSNLLAMHLDLLFSTFQISCVLDVGARCGEYGLWLRRNGYRGNIISFEPVRANFQDLSRVSSHDPNWHCANYALGVDDSIGSINVTSLTQFSSFRTPNATARAIFGEEPTVTAAEEVEIHRLDQVLDQFPVKAISGRTYLKLDTQGWDLEVLAGSERILDRVVALQTEVAVQPIYEEMPLMADSLAAIADRGFTVSGFFPVNLDERLALIELDLVAVRGDPTSIAKEWRRTRRG